MLEALRNRLNELSEKAKYVAEAASVEFEKIKLPEEQRNERLDTCLKCEHLFKPTTSCKLCGCFMKAKTYIPSQSCPINKWPAIKIELKKD